MLKMLLAVGAGGAIGSVARYLLAGQIGALVGAHFPWGTLAVNVIGCTAMGALVEVLALAWSPGPEVRAFLAIGILGGFTTFSSFTLDIGFLVGRQAFLPAVLYLGGSVLLSVAGFFAAQYATRAALG
jgi:fluoride exporter